MNQGPRLTMNIEDESESSFVHILAWRLTRVETEKRKGDLLPFVTLIQLSHPLGPTAFAASLVLFMSLSICTLCASLYSLCDLS